MSDEPDRSLGAWKTLRWRLGRLLYDHDPFGDLARANQAEVRMQFLLVQLRQRANPIVIHLVKENYGTRIPTSTTLIGEDEEDVIWVALIFRTPAYRIV